MAGYGGAEQPAPPLAVRGRCTLRVSELTTGRPRASLPAPQATPICDKVVFGKIKERLGGRVRLIVSGGAPLARHVEDFLRVAMCCRVVQGYGLTETCAASFIAVPDVPVSSARGAQSAHSRAAHRSACSPSFPARTPPSFALEPRGVPQNRD